MTQLEVVVLDLGFACCHCEQAIGVTLRCEGKGLADDSRGLAVADVPCPACTAVNLVYFEPSGQLHSVGLYKLPRSVPEPSLN